MMNKKIQAHWIAGRDYINREAWYLCSVCYTRVNAPEAIKYKFCPFCGYPICRKGEKRNERLFIHGKSRT